MEIHAQSRHFMYKNDNRYRAYHSTMNKTKVYSQQLKQLTQMIKY